MSPPITGPTPVALGGVVGEGVDRQVLERLVVVGNQVAPGAVDSRAEFTLEGVGSGQLGSLGSGPGFGHLHTSRGLHVRIFLIKLVDEEGQELVGVVLSVVIEGSLPYSPHRRSPGFAGGGEWPRRAQPGPAGPV